MRDNAFRQPKRLLTAGLKEEKVGLKRHGLHAGENQALMSATNIELRLIRKSNVFSRTAALNAMYKSCAVL